MSQTSKNPIVTGFLILALLYHKGIHVQLEKRRAYHRAYYKEYRAKNLEKQREYDRMKAREYRAKKKQQSA